MERPFPAYIGDEPYLFVSYAHEDAALVYPEIQWLKAQGFNIWYDEGISPGARWSDELATRLKGASLFLFFATPEAVASRHCLDEINLALDGDRPTIAVHLRPTELTPGLELRLSSHQAILKYESNDEAYRDKLLSGIARHLEASPSDVAAAQVTSNGRRPRFIEVALAGLVVFGIGYIIHHQAEEATHETPPVISEESTPPSTDAGASKSDQPPSIAVLPFANMSNDPEQEYFSDGMADDILNSLVKHTNMKVIARTSSFQFKDKSVDIREIGEQLGVTHILEGSVRKAGNRIRVTAQLNSTQDGSHLWSDQYDRELDDIFAVQDDITRRIVEALRAELVVPVEGAAPTENVEAYSQLLLARYQNARGEYDEAIESAARAIELDPGYVEAYVMQAYAHGNVAAAGLVPWSEKIPIRESLLAKARSIDPDNTGVRSLQAWNTFNVARDYQAALNEYAELCLILTLACNNYGNMLTSLGFFEQALLAYDRCLADDPLSPMTLGNKSMVLRRMGRFDDALDTMAMIERLGVPNPLGFARLAWLRGDMAALRAQVSRRPSDWGSRGEIWLPVYTALLAYADEDEASKIAAQEELATLRYIPDQARVYLALAEGDLDGALIAFERMAADRNDSIQRLAIERRSNPHFGAIKDHPRFQNVLRDLGIDDASLAKLRVPPFPEG